MSYQTILTEQRGRVAIVKLNRPERLNALSYPLVYELYDAFERFNADNSVGVIILTGEGRAFCAGLDVQEWQNPEPAAPGEPMNYRSQLRWLEMMRRSKPVVVAVNGLAVGGGITVILSCDLRIASDRAQFEERHVRVGLMPDMGSSRLLVQAVGLAHALRLQLTGRRIDAREAERIHHLLLVQPHQLPRSHRGAECAHDPRRVESPVPEPGVDGGIYPAVDLVAGDESGYELFAR